MKNMTHDQVIAYAALVKRLEEWAEANAARNAIRDALIREAHEADLSNTEIAARMKISRTTVIQVLGTDDETEEEQS